MKRKRLLVVALLAMVVVVSLGGLVTAHAHDGPAVVAAVLDADGTNMAGVSVLPLKVQLFRALVTDTNYSEEVRSDGLMRSRSDANPGAKESEPRARDVRNFERG